MDVQARYTHLGTYLNTYYVTGICWTRPIRLRSMGAIRLSTSVTRRNITWMDLTHDQNKYYSEECVQCPVSIVYADKQSSRNSRPPSGQASLSDSSITRWEQSHQQGLLTLRRAMRQQFGLHTQLLPSYEKTWEYCLSYLKTCVSSLIMCTICELLLMKKEGLAIAFYDFGIDNNLT